MIIRRERRLKKKEENLRIQNEIEQNMIRSAQIEEELRNLQSYYKNTNRSEKTLNTKNQKALREEYEKIQTKLNSLNN